MDFAFDRSRDLSRQVRNALEDETAQPLREVQRHAPEGCDYFSELEASLGEWSFGYGVAWALARAGDPMLSSSAAARLAEAAVAEAWSLFSTNQRWTALMAADRAERGPVDAEPAPPRVSRPPTSASSWRRSRAPAHAASASSAPRAPTGKIRGDLTHKPQPLARLAVARRGQPAWRFCLPVTSPVALQNPEEERNCVRSS